MKSNTVPTALARCRPPRRITTTVAVVAALSLGFGIAACGSDAKGAGTDVTTIGTPGPASTSTPSNDGDSSPTTDGAPVSPDPVAYSQCMRDNGIDKFPDPNASGDIALNASALGVNPDSPQFKAALQACKELLPPPDVSSDHPVGRDTVLKYSQCMRDNGISDFPDPNADGGLQVTGIDQSSPQFAAADKACAQFFPGGAGGGGTSSGGGNG